MTDISSPTRTITPKGHLGTRVRDIFRYRELLVNLVRKDLKVRYKSSVLGFLWSLLNPAMLLIVYYLVFGQAGLPFIVTMAALIFVKHHANIRRLLDGAEARIGAKS